MEGFRTGGPAVDNPSILLISDVVHVPAPFWESQEDRGETVK